MISYVEGEVISKREETLSVLTNSGVAYEVFLGDKTQRVANTGDKVSFHTHLKLGENDLQLYGFETDEEKSFFQTLISVSGLGPKSAIRVLSLGTLNDIKSAIQREDKDYLTAVKGIGKKTAGRMIVELQSKVEIDQDSNDEQNSRIKSEVLDALVSMGYSKQKAKHAVNDLETKGKTVEKALKQVLKKLS